jgi:hypothetical protein
MDPITLAILAGTAGTAAGQLPQLIPSKFERQNKARLEALQRQQRAGTLGLTGQEEALMERQLAGRSQAAAQGAEAERNRLLAGSGGAMAGGALLGAQLAEEERQRAEERISTDIMSADLQRKRQQEEEIRALQAAEGQRQAEAQAAAGAIIGAGVEAGVTTGAQERLFAGARSPSTQTVQALSQSLGVSPDEARGYIELSITNPEVFKYLTAVQGGKMGGQ